MVHECLALVDSTKGARGSKQSAGHAKRGIVRRHVEYNTPMDRDLFDKFKLQLDFGPQDVANMVDVADTFRPVVGDVVERFVQSILGGPESPTLLSGGEPQVARLRELLRSWLERLFDETIDLGRCERLRALGGAHVRAGVPQHLLIAGVEMVWGEFERTARAAVSLPTDRALRSFHKLLMLDLTVILAGYEEQYAEKVRKSERSAVEEKLTRAEHLAEIGQLAASLAHEIKNPLAGISGAIQIIRDAMSPDDPHQPIITEILSQINRLDDTVKDLLQYARPTPPRLSAFTMDQVVDRVMKVLRTEPALRRVRVECGRVPPDVSVYADDAQIEQLIINLVLNAAHASEGEGGIQLAVSEEDESVTLVVKDHGKGMSEEVREQAFEPFFTTKARGTGLGLSICKRIAEAHGGRIGMASELGRGTAVTVVLPRRAPHTLPEDKR